jgi:hypothetical protein
VIAMIRSRAFLLLNLAHFFDHFVLLILPAAALATNRQDYAGALAPAASRWRPCPPAGSATVGAGSE